MIHVFGHLSPDTDATGSAIIWAWYLNEHKNQLATAYILGALNPETMFVLNYFDLAAPDQLPELATESNVVIVDTNNPQELPPNVSELTILQLIDHHKLIGGLMTKLPTDITIRPLACTATVLYDLMQLEQSRLPRPIAGLLLSCILSDTLAFRSPTTTPHDQEVAETLAETLGIDLIPYANQMFAAKSDVSRFTEAELTTLDSKKFTVGDKTIRVSVIETTTPETILARKDAIMTAMTNSLASESDVDDILFFVIDIFREEATVFTGSSLAKQIIAASFNVVVTEDTTVLPGILSRKQQIVPVLTL